MANDNDDDDTDRKSKEKVNINDNLLSGRPGSPKSKYLYPLSNIDYNIGHIDDNDKELRKAMGEGGGSKYLPTVADTK